MGGSIAIAIKRQGKLTTRILPKYASSGLTRGDFFEKRGMFWREWRQGEKSDFVPYGYGLVVIDFDKKWAAGILGGYCNFNEAHIRLTRSDDVEDFKLLWEQRRIQSIVVYRFSGENDHIPLPRKKQGSLEKIMDRIDAHCWTKDGTLIAEVSPPEGWTIQEMEEDPKGWADLIDAMKDQGIEINKKSLEAWGVYLQDRIGTSSPIDALKAATVSEMLQEATVVTKSRSCCLARAQFHNHLDAPAHCASFIACSGVGLI